MEKYGLLKHIKSGQFLNFDTIDGITYCSAFKNIYKASILTEQEANDYYLDDIYERMFKETSFQSETKSYYVETIDISNDELEFIECELTLKVK
jgi:hypothetical protein